MRLLTRLEYQSASNIDIPAITRGLDALIRSNQRTYYKSGCLTDAIERAEFDAHGRKLRIKLRIEGVTPCANV
jgi:hypothetical protein